MEKKTEIIIVAGVTVAIIAVGTVTATVILCRRLYDKHYITVNL